MHTCMGRHTLAGASQLLPGAGAGYMTSDCELSPTPAAAHSWPDRAASSSDTPTEPDVSKQACAHELKARLHCQWSRLLSSGNVRGLRTVLSCRFCSAPGLEPTNSVALLHPKPKAKGIRLDMGRVGTMQGAGGRQGGQRQSRRWSAG